MSRIRKNNESKFNKILQQEGITVYELHKHCQNLGYKITYPNVNDAVNHSRNITKVTMDRLVIALNDLTGKNFNYNDLFELFELE